LFLFFNFRGVKMDNILEGIQMDFKLGGGLPVQVVDSMLRHLQYLVSYASDGEHVRDANSFSSLILSHFTNDAVKLLIDYRKEEKAINEGKRLKMLKMSERRRKPI
jgi:hypothetical protein